MTYAVKEIFKTLQGEGYHTGRAAVFCRFSGCNLWSGREEDRASAVCRFCDTDFLGGTRYDDYDLVDAIESAWGSGRNRIVVFTGGEPMLQLNHTLVDAVRSKGFVVHVETNGTVPCRCRVNWITVSPKQGTSLKLSFASELKVVFPQDGMNYEAMRERFDADYNWLQPMDGPDREANTQGTIAYVLTHPWWRLSLQAHKFVGLR